MTTAGNVLVFVLALGAGGALALASIWRRRATAERTRADNYECELAGANARWAAWKGLAESLEAETARVRAEHSRQVYAVDERTQDQIARYRHAAHVAATALFRTETGQTTDHESPALILALIDRCETRQRTQLTTCPVDQPCTVCQARETILHRAPSAAAAHATANNTRYRDQASAYHRIGQQAMSRALKAQKRITILERQLLRAQATVDHLKATLAAQILKSAPTDQTPNG